MTVTYTTPEELAESLSILRTTFSSGKTKDIAWRKWQLKQVWWMIHDNEDAIVQALQQDLNRHRFESYASDILGIKSDILDQLEHVEKWAADHIPKEAGFIFGTLGKARVRKEPLGVALIIGAWNFPLLLLLQPMLAAITAGNCVLLKPSELAVACETLLVDLVPKYLDQDAIRIVTAGPNEMPEILKQKYDHIFFTGSNKIARFITAAAAKHLTPTVLELGGQGPAIVTKLADVDLAAKRIAYAKFLNAGQICLSVNHVFVDPAVYDQFIESISKWNDKFLGEGKGDLCQIINDRNYARLEKMLAATQGKVVYGRKGDARQRLLYPTVVGDISMSDPLLSEELFGPILPVVKADYKSAYEIIRKMDHPLAIYIFSSSQAEIDEIIANTNSGGVTINDVLMHAGVHGAPFGGVGESGYGYYHGVHGFDAFTHTRTIVGPPTWLDKVMSFRYPPFHVKHIPKIEVKNKIGFKRGETLADQKIKSGSGPFSRAKTVISIVVLLAGLFLLTGASDGFKASLFNICSTYSEKYLRPLIHSVQLTLPKS
ncbi:aldehyde dehydrogenase 3I1 [Myxozyma melibiosi]|uniref:Aldehyde dehydrogenase n=1 Tax=Myxozyma melibiosi TaxID=54550 RepID=A0ABR1F307_9ASCO